MSQTMKVEQVAACSSCGQEFVKYRPNNLYCSKKECRQKARNERWREWKARRVADGTFRDIINVQQQRYREANPNYSRDMELKRKYGITFEDWLVLLEKANGQCEICGSTDRLCVDHDHAYGQIRGVLCSKCNRALGQLGDNIEQIKKVIGYLAKTDVG